MDPLSDGHQWLRTKVDGRLDDNIWAGGDDRGPGIASQAIAQGRLAAESAHAELRGEPRLPAASERQPVSADAVKTDFYRGRSRGVRPRLSRKEWLGRPDSEIDQTISYEQAEQEAARCMSCGLCFDCQQCFMYCNAGGFTRVEGSRPGYYFVLALDACEGCGKCIEICPSGYLEKRDSD